MKSVLIALALTISTAAMAKIPATTALANLLPSGEYLGSNEAQACTVKIVINENSASVVIASQKSSKAYALINSSMNYSVDATTNEISATQSLNAPFYLNGGTQILNVKPTADAIIFSIATIALDHKGNDFSSFAACTLLK